MIKLRANLDVSGLFRDIGKLLAEGASKNPIISALALIVLIAAIVAIVFGENNALYLFFILTVIVVIGLIYLYQKGLSSYKRKIQQYTSENINMGISSVNELTESQKQNIKEVLKNAAKDVASSLETSPDFIRSNVFRLFDDNRLRIFEDLVYNMDRAEELTISMPAGYGSTGRCFSTGKPNIALFRENWGENAIEDEELKKAHPNLRWIISVPVFININDQPVLILNVDGLKERRSEDELQKALRYLFNWSQMISLIITKR